MPRFLSDSEMDEVEAISGQGGAGFVSDDDMAKMEAPEEQPAFTAKGLARGAIDAIPYVGAVGGGVLGTGLSPGVGTVGGAGLGYAAGAELSDFLKNRLLGDEAASVEPVDQLKRVAGNVATGATAEMGGQLLGKGLGAAGSAIKNQVDDIATAPLGQAGERGMAAGLMDKIHRAGKAGNQFVDDIAKKLTPETGNAQADALLKGAQRVGRYGAAGKAQGTIDAMEHLPKAAQWAAGKASPMLEKAASMGPYAQELSQRSPQLLQSLMSKRESKPYDKNQIMQKAQGTQFDQTLKNAAQRGDEAFNATYFVLQNNPEFRKAVRFDDEQGD